MSANLLTNSTNMLKNLTLEDSYPSYSDTTNGGIWRILPFDSNHIIGASYDHSVQIWKIKKVDDDFEINRHHVLKGHTKEVLSLVKLDENRVLTGSADSTINVWNAHKGTLTKCITDNLPTGFYSMALIDKNTIATGSCQRPKNYNGVWNHVIKIFNISTNSFQFQLTGHKGGISALIYLNNNRLASASADKTIKIWDLQKKSNIKTLNNHSDYIYGLTKLDDNTLVSASRDKTIKLSDVETEKEKCNFIDTDDNTAHTSTVYDVDALTGDNLIISASRDGYVKLWDDRYNKCIKVLNPDDGFVYSSKFSTDSKIFASTAGKSDTKKHNKNQQNDTGHVIGWDRRKI